LFPGWPLSEHPAAQWRISGRAGQLLLITCKTFCAFFLPWLKRAHVCSIDDVHAALDRHPIELDRNAYLKRTLALELLRLDQLEMAFEGKALRDGDVSAGVLLVKIAERCSALPGLNAPLGHAVAVVQHPPENQLTSTDKIKAALNCLLEDGRRNGSGDPH
jgi:hypothetical protein